MTRHERLLENYEDAYFALLMEDVAQMEGARLDQLNMELQPQITAVLALAEGTSLVTEGVYGANRFKYVDELKRLGAHIQVDGKVAVVEGVKQLVGAPIQACDLRAGAALVIAGLAAQGTTELSHINYIERGYEDLVGKLRAVGADISLVDVPDEADTETHAG